MSNKNTDIKYIENINPLRIGYFMPGGYVAIHNPNAKSSIEWLKTKQDEKMANARANSR